jgi:hypothetical protein
MKRFWDEQLVVEQSGAGLVAALPMMYPDGWQIVVNLEPFSPTHVLASYKGRTLIMLEREGLNLEAKTSSNRSLLEEKKKIFELDQAGFELRKLIPLPVNGLDVQLFAESLVSISHLIYRNEPKGVVERVVRQSLLQTFKACNMTPKEDVYLPGKVEDRIQIDFLFEAKQQLAMKSIDINDRVKDYMERWAWRWTDLQKKNPTILRSMVYNPDQQDWDETSLKIGREVCDLFCPYYDRDQIRETIEKLSAA